MFETLVSGLKNLKWKIGGVYKVRGNWRPNETNQLDYYCTIIKHPKTGKLVTYIPNCFTRPLSNYCDLISRMSYKGTFEKYGHLLFNQDYLKNQGDPYKNNEFNTNFTFKTYADTARKNDQKAQP